MLTASDIREMTPVEAVQLVTVAEAARKIGKSHKTVLNWIYTGRLGGAQGLCYVVNRPMIDLPRFLAAFVRRAK